MHVNAFIYFFRFSLYLYTDQHITPIVDYVSKLICYLFNGPREYFFSYILRISIVVGRRATHSSERTVFACGVYINILPSILLVFTEQYPANWPCIWAGQTVFIALDHLFYLCILILEHILFDKV